jgi:pilus assembly protein CpaE
MTVPETSHRTRVIAIVDAGPIEQQIATALNTQPDFQLVDLVTALDKAPQTIRAAQPDVLLVNHELAGQPTIDALDDLAQQFPEVTLVAILPNGDATRIQQVTLAGARAFLIEPFTQVNLLSTLRRVRDLEARRAHVPSAASQAADGPARLQVISVFGPRGGTGTSTLALNLAIALFEETDRRVLLLEGKLGFGHLGLMLNLRTRNTLGELLPHAHALEENLVREVVAEHASGIHVLLAPASLEVAQGVRAEPLFSVVDGLRRFYDYIVVDAGNTLDENTVTLLDLADRVLLVAVPDLAALQDVSRFIQVSRTLNYPVGKVLTVLNRAGMPGSLRVPDIEGALHHELFAQVPDGGAEGLRSLNRGLPLLFKYPRSPASRGIQRMAKSLLRLGEAQPAAAAKPIRSNGSNGRGLGRLLGREKDGPDSGARKAGGNGATSGAALGEKPGTAAKAPQV